MFIERVNLRVICHTVQAELIDLLDRAGVKVDVLHLLMKGVKASNVNHLTEAEIKSELGMQLVEARTLKLYLNPQGQQPTTRTAS